jgi:hypothetical protein
VWLKCRSIAYNHRLVDSVQGVGSTLSSNLTNAAVNSSSEFTSLDSNGFSITQGAGYEFNNNAVPYVAWAWDAGGTGSSNTDGSITSTVSANPTAGFSIATYSGNGTAGATVGHGLGVAPSMIITKARGATSEWGVYHSALGNTKALLLNQNYDQQTSSLYWNNTSPTSTLFTLGSGSTTNSSTTYVAYCFTEVEGYSKFGSYTGNGSSDGPFVFTNFRPAWIMIKDSTGSGNSWYISDNKRNTYNVVNGRLMANLSNDESTSISICDFTSNGFKIRTSDSGWNTSSSTYIFAAFAEHPFGGSGVSPATAR